MKIKVTYRVPNAVDEKLDNRIKKALEAAGFKMYAAGCNRINGVRDIAFDDVESEES